MLPTVSNLLTMSCTKYLLNSIPISSIRPFLHPLLALDISNSESYHRGTPSFTDHLRTELLARIDWKERRLCGGGNCHSTRFPSSSREAYTDIYSEMGFLFNEDNDAYFFYMPRIRFDDLWVANAGINEHFLTESLCEN